ncbi:MULTISPECIES: YidC/Oxa1 family membrane protein insertase [unclassified Clostridioides]|uniref:YidC/Oxa1 family membrane protein insertase n=1 Tax=unclassified Clostridioides TaxID=2635829 RepID=UPI00038D65E4|nr:membrane insertase, YidC/Oxa1 family domain protein [Clostridioides difficile CD160]MCC0692457.1 YidC/Oxa1 family membrane protein insertase [Clostridioides sp. ZZV14-6387]MCI9978157.1 YidC/Oxa1 family membrane protein insertase [Clostridioides difficile]MDB3084374.1 sporulation protein [Clostridioides difficile]MDI0268041.1 YidC/Oxa1 family membrane protein insertase [Clostridioides difficile]
MNIIGNFLGMILKVIFEFVNHYGISIILFTILVKIILLPLTVKQTKSTKAMQDIQPRIKEIQEKYKNKPEKQNEEIVKLYGEAKINPLSGCLPLLIQFPILIGLFSVLREPVAHGVFANQAAFLAADNGFLWIKSLTAPDYVLAVFSGASAYVMQKVMTPKDQLQGSMKVMTYVMAGMSFYWGFIFPAGLTLYWTVSNLFSIAQYYLIMNPLKAKLAANSKEEKVNEKKPKINKK